MPMEELWCIENNDVCSISRKKCKECKLDDCKKTFKIIDMEEKETLIKQSEKLRNCLPEECKLCPHLEIISLSRMKVKCFYRLKDRCILYENKNKCNNTSI